MMDDLIKLLHEGNHSLVVSNGEVRTFDGRGVADLYRLLRQEPELLRGASVADKVIGKAAAALMIRGQVKEVHGDVVSSPAAELLRASGIKTSLTREVHHIINRDRSGWCPMESACYDLQSVDDIYETIRNIIESKKLG